MEKLKPLVVEVNRVMPLHFGAVYDSRMVLDHVITGRDDVIQINHGTVMPGCALSGATHEADEIYYILCGAGRCRLGEDTVEVHADQVIFIPAGCFHALDNTEGAEPLKILTFWRDWRDNEAYVERVRQWGVSYRTIDEESEGKTNE